MPPDPPDNLSSALTRNIRTLEERRAREAVGTTRQEKVVVACGFQRIAATCYDLIPARLPI